MIKEMTDFYIVYLSFLDVDVCFARVFSHVDDFDTRNFDSKTSQTRI